MINNKKEAFTLIELMAVIAIIAILAAILVPTVTGYITRAQKLKIIVEARELYSLVEINNVNGQLEGYDLEYLIESGYLSKSEYKLESLQNDIPYGTIVEMVKDIDSLNKIKIKNGKIIEWNGENKYHKKDF